MALPPRVCFTLCETSVRWDCSIADIAGWAAVGKLRIKTGIGLVCCGEAVFAGQIDISAMDLLPLFRRSGTGAVEGVVRRIMPPGHTDWLVITDPAGGVTITVADMLILAEDLFGFEDDHDMARRAANSASGSSPNDWEGMNVALIQRIHDRGLPATQGDGVSGDAAAKDCISLGGQRDAGHRSAQSGSSVPGSWRHRTGGTGRRNP